MATIASAGGLATVTGIEGITTISATIGSVSGATDLTAAPSKFKPVGSLKTARHYHTATRLLDGRVLIAGGQDNANKITDSAEIYDPTTGRFTPTGNMRRKRHTHTATLLQNGTVLITGGHTYSPDQYHRTAEIYDPVTGTFTLTGSMSVERFFHTATLLADGRVLIDQGAHNPAFSPQPANIYNPVTGTFTTSGSPPGGRTSHTATRLNSGVVLETGGFGNPGDAEVFDPATGVYFTAPSLTVPRYGHAATLLSDGRLLVSGGGDTCAASCTAELYDAIASAVTPAGPMSVARQLHTATRLDDGTVLVAGGYDATAELFDPSTNTFVAAGAMAGTRQGHTATLLQDGSVLLVGGYGPFAANGAELYIPRPLVPLSLTVTPTTASIQAGQTRAFTAVDHLGHSRDDAEWSVTNAGIATVDPDTGVVTGAAAGSTTVTASIGAVSGDAQIMVTTGPPSAGMSLWTVAVPAGATSHQLIPAAGAGRGGPSMLAVSTTTTETEVQGLTSDGQQQWRMSLPGPARQIVPNASGGVLVTMFDGCDGVNPLQLINIDGPTGMWGWQAVATLTCNHDLPQIAIRHDGAVAASTPGNIAGFPNLMMLDGDTGAPLSVPTIPQSTFTSAGGQQTPGYSRVGPTMIDVDGTVHLLYEKRFLTYPVQVVDTGIWLMSVRADQTYTTTQLNTTTQNTNLFPGRIIPDGQGGLLASWIDSPIVPVGQPPAQSTLRAARIPSGCCISLFDLPLTPPLELLHPPDTPLPTNLELVLGESDRAFVSYGNTVGGFEVSFPGGSDWSYTSANAITMLAADADSSLVAKTPAADGTDTILRFSELGDLTTSTLGLPNVRHIVGDLWTFSDPSAGRVISGDEVQRATTGWPWPSSQRRTRGVYRDSPGWPGHQRAAFEMMDELRPLADRVEVGAVVCVSGDTYRWSNNYIKGDAGSVDSLSAVCPSQFTVHSSIHLHTPDGETAPSYLGTQNDYQRAQDNPAVLFYLSAPMPDRSKGFRFIRYKHSPPGLPVQQNTCWWGGEQRGWEKTVSGVVVTCGAP